MLELCAWALTTVPGYAELVDRGRCLVSSELLGIPHDEVGALSPGLSPMLIVLQ